MSLIQSARLNEHDPYVYLEDVLTRMRRIGQVRLHGSYHQRWSADFVGRMR